MRRKQAQAMWPDSWSLDEVMPDKHVVNHEAELGPNDCLILWGGEDISPAFYSEKASKYCHADDTYSVRDVTEAALFERAMKLGIPVLGICRGAQLVTALTGGKLFQHVNGHYHGGHLIKTRDGRTIYTNSIHHQMMNPKPGTFEPIAWANPRLADLFIGEHNKLLPPPDLELEIVFFPQHRTLAVQGHPEMYTHPNMFTRYVNELVKELLIKKDPSDI